MATTQNPTKPISSFLASPRFFNGFFMTKTLHDQQSSPTSILDTKQLFTNSEINPFRFTKNPSKPRKSFEEIQNPFEKFESESENGIALALVQENPKYTIFKPNAVSRKILFGSNLKIQIPSYPLSDPFQNGSPEQSCDFGIKTRNLQFSGHLTRTGSGSTQTSMDALSLSEMELSEEYTRVVSYGSNPKTTHIYDNCVVETDPKSPYQNFLSFCHTCKKNLDDNCDIFMYRGEKAFCSEECRCEEMVLDGLMKSDQPS